MRALKGRTEIQMSYPIALYRSLLEDAINKRLFSIPTYPLFYNLD